MNDTNSTILKSNALMAEASMPQLKAQLGDTKFGIIDVTPSLDTCSTHNFLSMKIFNTIPNKEKYILKKQNITVKTGSGPESAPAYYCRFPLHTRDSKGKHYIFHIPVWVVQFLKSEFFLGNNFLLKSGVFPAFRPHQLDLNENTHFPVIWDPSPNSIKLLLRSDLVLPPGASDYVQVYPNQDITPGEDFIIAESFDPMLEEDDDDTYVIIPSVAKYNKRGVYHTLIRNDSNYYLNFATNTRIADMQRISKQNCFLQLQPCTDVNLIEVTTDDPKFLNLLRKEGDMPHNVDADFCKLHKIESSSTKLPKIHQNKPKPTPMEQSEIVHDYKEAKAYRQDTNSNLYKKVKRHIDESTVMNDEEKLRAMEQFIESGYYTHTASDAIEDNRKTTELKHDTTPITHDECVQRVDLSHLSSNQQLLSQRMLQRCKTAFARHEWDIPPVKGFILDPVVKEGYKNLTLNTKYVPTAQQNREELDQVIDTMVKNDIIVRTDEPTPVINNIMTTLKASGKKRYLLDSRAVNLVTRRAQVALTPKHDIFQHIGTSKYLTVLDIQNAYFSIEIAKEKIPLFSFYNSKRERHAFKRAPQGHHSSCEVLERVMQSVIGVSKYALNYCDDIYIATPGTFEEHIIEVEKVMQSIIDHGLKCKPEKMKICEEYCDILGFTFHKGEFHVPKLKLNAISELTAPTTPKRTKRFLAMLKYYEHHIYKFSDYIGPLQALACLDNPRQFKWTREANDAFELLKQLLIKYIPICAAILDLPIYIASDASTVAAGVIIYQRILISKEGEDEKYDTRYIGCHSRLFTKQERSMSSFKLECLSLLCGLSSYDYILRYAHHIIAIVDCRAILFLRATKVTTTMNMRIAEALSYYPMEIRHIKTTNTHTNWLPDIVSRNVDVTKFDHNIKMTEVEADQLFKIVSVPNDFGISQETLRRYLTDEAFESIVKKVESKKRPARTSKVVLQDSSTSTKPTLMPSKKPRLPKLVEKHPFYPTQYRDLNKTTKDFTKPSKAKPSPLQRTDIQLEQALKVMQLSAHNNYDDYNDDEKSFYHLNIMSEYQTYGSEAISEYILNNVYNFAKLHGQDTDFFLYKLLHTTSLEQENPMSFDEFTLNAKIVRDGKLSLQVLKEEQSRDTFIQEILEQNPLPKPFFLHKGFLLAKIRGNDRIVVPQSLMSNLKKQLHHSILGLHQSAKLMHARISKLFWHPTLLEQLQSAEKSCVLCRSEKITNAKQAFGAKQLSPIARAQWSVDVCSGFTDAGPAKYLFCFVEQLSLYSIIVPSPHKDAKRLLQAFRDHIYTPFGCRSIYSDQDPALLSHEFEEFCDQMGVEIRTTKPYCPFSNGMVEKYQSYLQNAIRTYTKQTGLPYQDLLGLIQKSLNKRLLSVRPYEFTPEILMFGNSLPDNNDFLQVEEPQEEINPATFCDVMIQKLSQIRDRYLSKRNKINDDNREIVNRKRVQNTFQIGDIVYVRDLTIAQTAGGALKSKFVGPYVVEEVNDTRLECKLQSLTDRKKCIRHMAHIKKQEHMDNNNFVPTMLEENNLTSDDVEPTEVPVDNLIQDESSDPNPLNAIDDAETEPLIQPVEQDENLFQESPISDDPVPLRTTGSKRKSRVANLSPTRRSARIRADNYSHSEVSIRK